MGEDSDDNDVKPNTDSNTSLWNNYSCVKCGYNGKYKKTTSYFKCSKCGAYKAGTTAKEVVKKVKETVKEATDTAGKVITGTLKAESPKKDTTPVADIVPSKGEETWSKNLKNLVIAIPIIAIGLKGLTYLLANREAMQQQTKAKLPRPPF